MSRTGIIIAAVSFVVLAFIGYLMTRYVARRRRLQRSRRNLLLVISNMRAAARLADDINDPGTVDLFSRTVQLHEKHEWFLRQILVQKDGLTG